jgi:hypothetical protein
VRGRDFVGKILKNMEFFGEKRVFLLKSWRKSQKIDKKVILVDIEDDLLIMALLVFRVFWKKLPN